MERCRSDAPVLVLDLKNLIYVDSSGADALMNLIHSCRKKQVHLIVSGLMHQPLDIFKRSGLIQHLDGQLEPDLASGLSHALYLAPSSPSPQGDGADR